MNERSLKAIARFLAGLLAACQLAPDARADADLYVSPQGSDQAAGTREHPLATLDAARDQVRALKRQGGLPEGGVHVYLRAGIYSLRGSFTLGEDDSGTAERPIEYRAYPGERVILTGAAPLPADAFHAVTDPAVLRRLPPVSRGAVRQVDLGRLGITDYGRLTQYGHGQPVTVAPLELFFNAEPMPLARYPNSGWLLLGRIIDPGSIPRWGDESHRGGTFVAPGAPLDRWVGQDDIWLRGTFSNGYADDNIRIASVDPARHRITLATPHLYGLASGKPFQHYLALNILEELDSPGEWYLDRKTGALYFWPPGPLEGARITVSLLKEPLIVLQDVSHVALTHLTIEGGRGMGVYLEGGRGDTIDHCTIRDLGTLGILMGQGSRQVSLHPAAIDGYQGRVVSREIGNLQNQLYQNPAWDRRGGSDHRIANCHVYGTGSGGIYLSGGSKQRLIPGRCAVENCRIHDYNRRNEFLWAGIDVDGCGNRVAHCEIYGSDFQGIYVHGNDHVFEYNYLHDLALDSDDTSAWYIGRDPSDQGNIVRDNFFRHVGRTDRSVMAVYLDDSTCGVTVSGNVFYQAGTRASIFNNSGSDLTLQNNVFIDSPKAAVELDSYWYLDHRAAAVIQAFGPHGLFPHRLTDVVDIRKPPYSTRYPNLRDWLDPLPGGKEWVGMRLERNVMARNVVVRCGRGLLLKGRYAECQASDNDETSGDPGFVDAAKLDFQLRPDSVVFRRIPGFEPIPFDQIGLRPGGVGADEGS